MIILSVKYYSRVGFVAIFFAHVDTTSTALQEFYRLQTRHESTIIKWSLYPLGQEVRLAQSHPFHLK